MTWSIVARATDGAYGVAVASRFFAVGALCPYAQSGAGALSTQALVNPLYGPRALALLAAGADAQAIVQTLTTTDEGRAHRQLHVIDQQGCCAAHTGAACIDWCGHATGAGYSVAGNMLAGPGVLDATASVYESGAALPFAQRLVEALAAGEAAGGDKRGKQAAALLVYRDEEYPALDLRVDDHHEPIVELRRLYRTSLERYQPFVACLPSRVRPAGITDRSEIEAAVTRFQAMRPQSSR
jgi:uncharacterized Ntn-hydrolase superfamily protein